MAISTKKTGETVGLLLSLMDAIRGDVQVGLTESSSFMHVKTLDYISKKVSPHMSEIAEYLKITSPGATMVVDRLVENGDIDRLQDSADRRLIRLQITKKGKETLSHGMRIVRNLIEQRISILTKEEQKDFKSFLEKLTGAK